MKLELRDSLESLYPDSPVGDPPRRAMRLDVARGATASVHVLLNELPLGAAIRPRLLSGGQPVADARWFRLVDVPVERNTGTVAFVEKEGERNPYVTRRAPFRVYDAMAPLSDATHADVPTIALRLHLPIPRDAEPGEYSYELQLQVDGESQTLDMTLVIHGAVIPPVGRDSFPYTNWFSLENIARRHGLELWSEGHWAMIRRYARLMVRARQNTFWLPLRYLFDVTDGRPRLNRARLHRLVDVFTDAGMYYIEGGHVASRTGGVWEATTFDLNLVPVRATSVAGNAVLAQICRQLISEIEANGWRRRWLQHAADEPTPTNATDYRILVGMLHKYMPGIPVLDATEDPGLVGSVDIWCPKEEEYQRHRDHFDAQKELGDRVWFYTCCFPGGPWLNRLLDMELLRPALFGWGAALFDLDGFLHWGLNHYKDDQDPFEQSVVKHGGNNYLPAGDTHVVYPGTDGPWSSLRLEAQREGFEDYELLRILRGRDEEKATKVIGIALRAFDDYTRDVGTFREARRALLNAVGHVNPDEG